MGLSPDINASLRALSADAGSDRDLVFGLQQLLKTAAQAVPSCLGVSLTVVRELTPVTLVALAAIKQRPPVLSSLAVSLPAPGGAASGASRALILYAAAAGAFASMAADLLALLDLDPRRAMFDEHLELPLAGPAAEMLADQLDDLTVIDRALGVLLDKGLPGATGRLELEHLAARHNVDVASAAALVLSTVRRPSPDALGSTAG